MVTNTIRHPISVILDGLRVLSTVAINEGAVNNGINGKLLADGLQFSRWVYVSAKVVDKPLINYWASTGSRPLYSTELPDFMVMLSNRQYCKITHSERLVHSMHNSGNNVVNGRVSKEAFIEMRNDMLKLMGTPYDDLFEYPHRADDSRDYINKAEAMVIKHLTLLGLNW